jgi:hypothetical protein
VNAQETAGEEQKPGLLKRGWDKLQELIADDRKKWGGMTAGAMFRLGLAELREALSWNGGRIAPPTPLGMYGTLTPGEVGVAREIKNANIRQMEEEPLMNDNQPLPSPSEIADGKASASVHGETQQLSNANQPGQSEISEGQGQQQNQSQQQAQVNGQSRGRGM